MNRYTYGIIGAGRTGRAAAFDLAHRGEARALRVFDVDAHLAARTAAYLRERAPAGVEIASAALDASDERAVVAAIGGCDAVMSCVPYFLNPGLARAAVAAGAHMNDLGGNTAVVEAELALDPLARERGVSIVPDCGLAPGLVNVLAAAGIARLDEAESVRLYCGGLPQDPRPPLDYAISFSVRGLVNEYTGEALCLRDGRLASVPTLTEVEAVAWDGLPPLEAFVTSGGSSTAPRSFAGRVRDYDYKTLRYRGHVDKLKLLDALGLFSLEPVQVDGAAVVPRRLFETVLEPRITFPDSRDLILVRAVVEGRRDGAPRRVTFEMIDRYDEVTGLAAMERMTSFPAAVVTWLQARGEVPPGAHPLELAVDAEPYLDEVRRRGLDLREL